MAAPAAASLETAYPDLVAALGPHETLLPVTIHMGAQGLGIGLDEDVHVTELVPGSPAEQAGVRPGDMLLVFNDIRISPGANVSQVLAGACRRDGENSLLFRRDDAPNGAASEPGAPEEPTAVGTYAEETPDKKRLNFWESWRQRLRNGGKNRKETRCCFMFTDDNRWTCFS
mmetsp:Transcript_48342/g.127218  ORF Transcript_48342/g.127218 Transcript_48342/m.127218 type:complete len:172 (+) Transcript_48342:68-583(+)